jgi:hypothetical protein
MDVGPEWGWAIVFGWVIFQLYNPLWETKLQQFHHDLTRRLERIEIVQVSLAEEVEEVDETFVKEVHGRSGLTTGDLKDMEGQRGD